MKKPIHVKIRGSHNYFDDQNSMELFAEGFLYKKNGKYYISYDDVDIHTDQEYKTVIRIDHDKKVSYLRNGTIDYHLMLEKGKRNLGTVTTQFGDLQVGVYCRSLICDINDNGGKLHIEYNVDINASSASENVIDLEIVE